MILSVQDFKNLLCLSAFSKPNCYFKNKKNNLNWVKYKKNFLYTLIYIKLFFILFKLFYKKIKII